MLFSHALLLKALTNNLWAYQMSYLENHAGPKMGRQISGDFGGTKMAINSLKNKIQKVLA